MSPNGAPLALRTHPVGTHGSVRVLYFSKDPPTGDPMGRQGSSGSYRSIYWVLGPLLLPPLYIYIYYIGQILLDL
jgi:hypothetical protein